MFGLHVELFGWHLDLGVAREPDDEDDDLAEYPPLRVIPGGLLEAPEPAHPFLGFSPPGVDPYDPEDDDT